MELQISDDSQIYTLMVFPETHRRALTDYKFAAEFLNNHKIQVNRTSGKSSCSGRFSTNNFSAWRCSSSVNNSDSCDCLELELIDPSTNELYRLFVDLENYNRAEADVYFATKLLASHKKLLEKQCSHALQTPEQNKELSYDDFIDNFQDEDEENDVCENPNNKGNKRNIWKEPQTKLLISLYKQYDEEFSSGKLTYRRFWKQIVDGLQNKGYNVSTVQCTSLMDTLKRVYKKTKDHNNQSGNEKKSCNYYELIFRKVADVRREMELAERRKNEPQLDQSQDHLVRKIFSRFKTEGEQQITMSGRASSNRSNQDSDEELTVSVLPPWPSFRFRKERHAADVEKGDGKDGKESETGSQIRKISSASEDAGSGRVRPSKWGRLLEFKKSAVVPKLSPEVEDDLWESKRSSSLDSGSDGGNVPEPFKRSLSARDSRASSSGSTNKVFPKLAKLGGTIEEDTETLSAKDPPQTQALVIQDSKQLQMRRLESYDGGLIVQPSHEREILAAVLEVKVDLKLEVQRVNQRLAKIEDMLQTLMTRLPAPGSPHQPATTTSTAVPGTGTPPSSVPIPSPSPLQPIAPRGLSAMVAALPSSGVSGPGNGGATVVAQTSTAVQSPVGVVPALMLQQLGSANVSPISGQEAKSGSAVPTTPSSTRESEPPSATDRLLPQSPITSGPQQSLGPTPGSLVHHHHHHHHQSTSIGGGGGGSSFGPLLRRKRQSKSRNKGAAPLAPLASQPISPSEPTECTQMLPPEPGDESRGPDERAERSERSKRPAPRPGEEYL